MGVPELKTKARDAFRKKRYELSIDMYLEALRFAPGDKELVEGFFQAARKLRETKGKAMFGGMFSKMSVGTSRDPEKRMAACFRGLAKNPENKTLLLALGEAAGQVGAEETAVEAYRIATEVDAEDAVSWKLLGRYLGRLGRIPDALAALGHSVRLNPKDQEAAKLRKNLAAEGALQKGRYQEAESTRELLKDQDETRRLEADQRLQLTPDHAKKEVTLIREKVQDAPEDPRGWVRLGELILQTGEEQEALEAFGRARSLQPENYDLAVRVGDMELRQRQAVAQRAKEAHLASPDDEALKQAREEALRTFLQAQKTEYARRVKDHPMDLAERFKLGRTLLAMNDFDAAAAEFQQTVRDPRRKTESLLLLAQCFEKKNLTGLALKKLEEAVEDFPSPTSPQDKDVHYAYGALLERAQKREEARKVFEGIFEVDITYRDVSQRLERLTQVG